jgi:hypothetical protein
MRRPWTKDEDEFLQREFATADRKHLETELARTWSSIEHHAHRLGLSRDDTWTNAELHLLQELYETASKETLLQRFPRRSWSGIVNQGKKLKISSRRHRRKSDVSKLLDSSHESLYWIGFLLADGHFNTRIGEYAIELALAAKDEDHVRRFAAYIQCQRIDKTKDGKLRVRACDSLNVRALAERYDLKSRKTYDPPNVSVFENLPDDLCRSIIIGFFDGDGHTTKRNTGRIQIHVNWLDVLRSFARRIGASEPYLNGQGFADWYISRPILRDLACHARSHSLPIMDRKWKSISTADASPIPVCAKPQSSSQVLT